MTGCRLFATVKILVVLLLTDLTSSNKISDLNSKVILNSAQSDENLGQNYFSEDLSSFWDTSSSNK